MLGILTLGILYKTTVNVLVNVTSSSELVKPTV